MWPHLPLEVLERHRLTQNQWDAHEWLKKILILFSVLCAKCPKVSRVPKSQQTTITSHFGSRTFSLPSFHGLLVTILRLLGSQNTGPSRRGAKEIQNLRHLTPYKNYPSGLESYKMKFGGSPLPSISHLARHRNPSTKTIESVSILVQFPYIINGVILLTFGPRFTFQDFRRFWHLQKNNYQDTVIWYGMRSYVTPSRTGSLLKRQGNSKSKTSRPLQKLSIRPWILQNEIWGVTPALNQPPCQTQKSFNKKIERVSILVQFPYIAASFC